ncbi:MAG: alcohol dehydrogenase catalytic domain-containing protein, partial [Acidimicrobiales bacterium]
MKALVFGRHAPPQTGGADLPDGEIGDELDQRLDRLPFGLFDVPDACLVRPDWVMTRPLLSGVCGSETKLILGEFDAGDVDNPMAAFSSIPHVPGHEVVAEVVALGSAARGVEVGQRVLLNPWLTCGPRGVDPPCPACVAGDLNLCWSFTTGALGPGVHVGVATDAPGGWADLMAAHDSMLIPVPDSISDDVAVLADPFAVSLHAIVRHPPRSGGRALVYGAGALGATSVAILRSLYPDVEVAVVARWRAQAELATRFGAALVLEPEPRSALVEALASWSGGVLHAGYSGLPMAHPGGI